MSTTSPPVPGVAPKVAAKRQVDIVDDSGHVNPAHDPVKISKSAKDVVVWFSANGKQSTIVFNSPAGSPFDKDRFTVPAGGNAPSGTVRDDAPLGNYKYTVVGEKGKNDPVVIVQN